LRDLARMWLLELKEQRELLKERGQRRNHRGTTKVRERETVISQLSTPKSNNGPESAESREASRKRTRATS